MEWDAERRARWLYHNRYQIEQNAYERGVQDQQVRQYIQKLEQENAQRDPGYVDKDFSQDPSLMYTDEHVNAIYNTPESSTSGRTVAFVLGGIVLGGLLCYGAFLLFFKVRIGN